MCLRHQLEARPQLRRLGEASAGLPDIPLCTAAKARYSGSHTHPEESRVANGSQSSVIQAVEVCAGIVVGAGVVVPRDVGVKKAVVGVRVCENRSQ